MSGQRHAGIINLTKITAITVQTKSGGQRHASILSIKKITKITVQTKSILALRQETRPGTSPSGDAGRAGNVMLAS
jgi:hypothetical protein